MRWFVLILLSVLAARADERFVLFPSLGQRVGDQWEIEIHGWVYEPERRAVSVALFREALELKIGRLADDEEIIFAERARLFLADNERGQWATVTFDGGAHRIGPSAANGHIHTRLRVPTRARNVHWLDETGLSVISDIDDTIKISEVRDRRALLRNTFCRPFQPAPGMAALYQTWAKVGAQFHYVSASPWQLYEPLADFIRTAGYPAGTYHMKLFRWKDESFFDLFDAPDKYKLGVFEPLLRRFPNRRFALVGDSGERDPEIYGTLARRHPQQIVHILIRDVTGEPVVTAERYRQAFRDLPAGSWTIFRDPPAAFPLAR